MKRKDEEGWKMRGCFCNDRRNDWSCQLSEDQNVRCWEWKMTTFRHPKSHGTNSTSAIWLVIPHPPLYIRAPAWK